MSGSLAIEDRLGRIEERLARIEGYGAVPPHPPIGRLSKLALTVTQFYGVLLSDLVARVRVQEVVWPRQVFCFLATDRGYGASAISRLVGRDHTTVIYSAQRVRGLIDTDPAVAREIIQLQEML